MLAFVVVFVAAYKRPTRCNSAPVTTMASSQSPSVTAEEGGPSGSEGGAIVVAVAVAEAMVVLVAVATDCNNCRQASTR